MMLSVRFLTFIGLFDVDFAAGTRGRSSIPSLSATNSSSVSAAVAPRTLLALRTLFDCLCAALLAVGADAGDVELASPRYQRVQQITFCTTVVSTLINCNAFLLAKLYVTVRIV